MIIFTMYVNKAGEYVGFESQGHSGLEESGKDIVCAGVSTATFGAMYNLQYNTEAKFDVETWSGYLKVILTEPNHEALLSFKMLMMMIEMVQGTPQASGRVEIRIKPLGD